MARDLPHVAAWRHVGARAGLEVVFLHRTAGGRRFAGHTTAVEDGVAWAVRYAIDVDAMWATRRAHVAVDSAAGRVEIQVEREDSGWLVNGEPAPELHCCADFDLETSAFT